jgi:FkbM family methyltransferase
MTLADTKARFKAGQISKPEYIDAMHRLHSRLFEYPDFIAATDVSRIEITARGVAVTAGPNNVTLLCDPLDKRIAPIEILNFDQYEAADSAMIFKLLASLPAEFTLFDIGANVGWYSINIAKSFPNSSVYSFEPIPRTYAQLVKNISLNEVPNVFPQNTGLSNQAGELTFYFYPEGAVNASSANVSGTAHAEQIVCTVNTLDEFAKAKDSSVDFVKCDVEGAELFVFQGGMEAIQQHRPVIFSEMLRKWSAGFNYHPNEIIALLKGAGYRCFTVHGNALSEFFAMDENTVETNFFFLHPEKHSAQIAELAG